MPLSIIRLSAGKQLKQKWDRPTLNNMLRYAITDKSFRTADGERWARDGVDYVQLRAKGMEAGKLLALAREIRSALQAGIETNGGAPKLLINGRADVAIAAGAEGVHLTAHPDELTPAQVRRVFQLAGAAKPVISVSAHTLAEVVHARKGGADLILFGPVLEKRVAGEVVVEGVGLEALRRACIAAGDLPVLALGGVTAKSASACMQAGTAGIAGIRLFARSR